MSDLNFEDQLKLLEQAVERLEGGDLTLEESLKVYEEGVLRVRQCRDALGKAEQWVTQLQEDAEGALKSTPFTPSGDA
jgi:exodeoxyribonuclease VII small subunit